jgi:protein-tyrosine phosphatase
LGARVTEAPTLAPFGGARFRRATPDELPQILALLTEGAARNRSAGSEHGWPVPFPAELVTPSLTQGCVYFIQDTERTVLGTLTLLWEDPRVWGPRPPDAGYVHRLAIRPQFSGRDLGRHALDWAAAEVKARHRSFLRLDTASSNPRLRQYYESLGFGVVGEASHDPLRFSVTLFERAVR